MIKFFMLVHILLSSIFSNPFLEEIHGPNSSKIDFLVFGNEDEAIAAVAKGGHQNGIDLYLYPITTAKVDSLKTLGNVGTVIDYKGKIFSLLLNPAPSSENFFNILSNKKIRQAINLLAGREYFKEGILKGYGSIMYTPISESDFDWRYVADLSFKYIENETIAYSTIKDTLLSLGANMINNTWYINNSPIKLRLVIRIDSEERYQYGIYLAKKLESLGFYIEEILANATLSDQLVYKNDPKLFNWSIYIEEWNFVDFLRYADYLVSQMYAPWYGYMPGWGNPRFWNYSNSTIDNITKKLVAADYRDEQERNELLRKALTLGLEESVRIFLVQKYNIYVYNSYRINSIIKQYYTGPANKFNFYNIKASREIDKPLRIGLKSFYLDSLNPIGGNIAPTYKLINDLISDQAFLRDPYNGKVINFRNKYEILNASNFLSIDVPLNAIYWDSNNHKWSYVNPGKKVRSEISYNIKYTKWHDNSTMNIYDILYWFYFLWEWSNKSDPLDAKYSPYIEAYYGPIISKIKGILIKSNEQVIIYADFYSFDGSELASLFPPWTTVPWQILFACEQLYLDNKISWFMEEAKLRNNSWLDFTDRDQSALINSTLYNDYLSKDFPPVLSGGVIPPMPLQEILSRYLNSTRFISKYFNAAISNGPFILSNFLKDMFIELVANDNYDLSQSYLFNLSKENFVSIKSVKYKKTILLGDNVSISLDVYLDGIRAKASNVTVYYWVHDDKGLVIRSGISDYNSTSFNIEFSSKGFKPGAYYVYLYAISNYSIIPAIYRDYLLIISITNQTNTNITVTSNQTIPTLPNVKTTTTATMTTTTITTGPFDETVLYVVLAVLIVALVFIINLVMRKIKILRK